MLLRQQQHVGRVDTQRDALALEGFNDAVAEGAQQIVLLRDACLRAHRVGQRPPGDAVDAGDAGRSDQPSFELLVLGNGLRDGLENLKDTRRIGRRIDCNRERRHGKVARQIRHRRHLRVRNDIEGAVTVAQPRQAQSQVFNGAGKRRDLDGFADVVLVFDDDEDAVDDVFEERLRGQADAHADNAGRGEQRFNIDPEQLQELQEENEAEDAEGGRTKNRRHRSQLGAAVRFHMVAGRYLAHAIDKELDNALSKEQEKKDDQELRQAVLDHHDDALVPVGFDGVPNGKRDGLLHLIDAGGDVMEYGLEEQSKVSFCCTCTVGLQLRAW